MTALGPKHGYTAHERFVVRVPLWDQQRFSDLTTYRALRASIPTLLGDERIAAALATASPSLVEQLRRLEAPGGAPEDERKTLGALRSLRKYLLRMTHRPTPFGLLAGVAVGRFAEATRLRVAVDPVARVEAFPDYAWLMGFAASIASGADARSLPLAANPYRQSIGERLDIAQSNVFGTDESNHVDLLRTPPVEAALSAASRGANADEIVAELHRAHPDVTRETIDAFVDTLLAQGVLYPDVVPALTPGQEATAMIAALRKGGAAFRTESDELARIVDGLGAVRDVADVVPALAAIRKRQVSLLADHSGPTVTVNAAVALSADELHRNVARRVEDVAEVLTRTSFFAARPPSIVEYEQHFLERYGVGGEVPILELLSAGRGLEAPSGYQLPQRSYQLPGQSPDENARGAAALLDAYTTALLTGEHLELTDDLLSLFTTDDPRPPSATFDLFVRVLARSAEAVDADDFDVAVLPDGLALGGRATGRFTGILDDAAELVETMLEREAEWSGPRTRLVQLRYLPDKARMANVARTAHAGIETLDVGVSPQGPGGMALSDILVGNDGVSFFLRDRRDGALIRIVENHMLSPLAAPNVIRLLVELSTDALRGFNIFDWGRLQGAPALPRVTRGRVIYSPAKWNVLPSRLPSSESPAEFAASLHAVRQALRMPARVTLVRDDNRLALDLEQEIDIAILAEESGRARTNDTILSFEETLDGAREAEGGSASGLLSDEDGARYAHELVVSVMLPAPEASADDQRGGAARGLAPTGIRTSQEWDPQWICLDVQGSRDDLDALVGSRLDDLLGATRSLRDRWFFIRYPMPAHALRIRLHARSPRVAHRLRDAVAGWADDLTRRRLIADSALVGYIPEFNRYGGEDLYRAALPVFEATSKLALEISRVRVAGAREQVADELLGVSILAHLYAAVGISHSALGIGPSTEPEFRQFYRENRQALMATLQEPADPFRGMGIEDRDHLTSALSASRRAFDDYAAAYRRVHHEEDFLSTAASVLHMTFNRSFPVGNVVEPRALGLWALSAEAFARRERAFIDLELVGSSAEERA
ncbi:lantibiotic dehydratase [Clavibacter sp. km1a]|uniref:lantibiotic dehydratase n=1 Tax=Clavibacter sp. km1a TaxID=3459136 RepID=UPI004041180F